MVSTMTEEEWQHLYKNFETAELLSAVDAVDCLRDDLNDGEGGRPLELRTNLLKLHELAMNLDEQVGQCGWGRAGGRKPGAVCLQQTIHNGLRRSLMRA
jgi:hypothetical protein